MKRKTKSPGLVGVIHLPALPGAPHSNLSVAQVCELAVREARELESAGFEALILENFGDVPFFKERVPPVTSSSMTAVACRVRDSVKLPLGINVLRNDALAALSIAVAADCQFIRVNVLSGVAATDQGIIEGRAAELMRERRALSAQGVEIWADALVKHARTLSTDDPVLAIEEVALRACADAVILTGTTTGREVSSTLIETALHMKLPVPIFLGSGTTAENLSECAAAVVASGGGVIVGSALRKAGKAGAPLDPQRVKRFARAWQALAE